MPNSDINQENIALAEFLRSKGAGKTAERALHNIGDRVTPEDLASSRSTFFSNFAAIVDNVFSDSADVPHTNIS